MRISRTSGHITLRDRLRRPWALGVFLLVGGVVCVAMPLGLATNAGDLEPWQRLASVGVGLGVSSGALWWLARSPATQVQLDLTHRRLRLTRFGLSGRQVRQLSFDDLVTADVEQGADSDGGMVWRPLVRLRGGDSVLLSELWSHDQAGGEASVAVLAEACRLPSPVRPTTVA